MDEARTSRTDRNWTLAASAALAGLLAVAALLGFVVVPLVEARGSSIDPWTVICRAAGLSGETRPEAGGPAEAGRIPISRVAWTPSLLDRLDAGDRKAGAKVAADVCSACHGEAGVSQTGLNPLLAGQSASVIYKQLHDYRNGARANLIMATIVRQLSERQMVDVAAYLSHDGAFHALGPRWPVPDPHAAALVQRGDPARDLPACDACHDRHAGGPIETPMLNGQNQEYLLAQLQLYASGARANDVYGRMRRVARKLTPGEMSELAEYYQGLD